MTFFAKRPGTKVLCPGEPLLANLEGVNTEDILDFKESLTVLLTSVLFIVLAARVPLVGLRADWFSVVVLLGFILFVARPLSVLAATLGSPLSWGRGRRRGGRGGRGWVCARAG